MHKFWYIPDLLILSILSMLEAEILIRGLLWLEDSEPPSAKESSNAKSISFTHLWQILCWQGRISGWVNNSLHAGQISSLSIPLMATFMIERGRKKCKRRKTRATKTYGTALCHQTPALQNKCTQFYLVWGTSLAKTNLNQHVWKHWQHSFQMKWALPLGKLSSSLGHVCIAGEERRGVVLIPLKDLVKRMQPYFLTIGVHMFSLLAGLRRWRRKKKLSVRLVKQQAFSTCNSHVRAETVLPSLG